MPYNNIITRAEAASLIPEPVAAEIIQDLPTQSAALQAFRRVAMSSGTERQPVLTVLPQAYWVGTTDTGLKQTSEQNWENVDLIARELAVIIPVPIAVVDDSSIDMWAEIRPRITEAFGTKIDAATLFGSDAPSDWPDSLAEMAVAAGNVVAQGGLDDIVLDISATWGEVEDDGYDVNVQFARRRLRRLLRDVRNQNGDPVFSDALTSRGPASLFGEDLLYVANGSWDSTYDLIVGDRNAAIIGIRQDMRFETFREGVIQDNNGAIVLNLMQQDAIALRATMRIGFATAIPASAEGGAGGSGADAGRAPFAVMTSAGS